MAPPPRALQRTAFHEAGHAVMTWLCDFDLGTVSIVPDEENGWNGYSAREGEGPRLTNEVQHRYNPELRWASSMTNSILMIV